MLHHLHKRLTTPLLWLSIGWLLPLPASGIDVHVAYDAGIAHLTVPGVYWQFSVERAENEAGPFVPQGFEYIGCTEACEWFDSELEPGETYWFTFQLLAQDGTLLRAGPTPVTLPVDAPGPLRCVCSPNPFTSELDLRFRIPAKLVDGKDAVRTRVTIHDVSGRTVRTLFEGETGRGVETIHFDGRDSSGRPLQNGVYFYTIQAGSVRQSGRILKLR